MRKPSRSPELARRVAEEKLPITVTTMDVDSDESVRDNIAAIQKEHGLIDVLLNNARVERAGSVEELALGEFRPVMETNYFGALRCIQAVAPHMRKRRSGCTINVARWLRRITSPPLAAYTASKWALEAMSEAFVGEMKTFRVLVAIVEPGIIDTAMARRIGERPEGLGYRQERALRCAVHGLAEKSGAAFAGWTEDFGSHGERRVATAASRGPDVSRECCSFSASNAAPSRVKPIQIFNSSLCSWMKSFWSSTSFA